MADKNECTIGVTLNGDNYEVKRIPSDSSVYDYTCIFIFKFDRSYFGNGSYKIDIKEPIHGGYVQKCMSIGKWSISRASIGYNWNEVGAGMEMTDEIGEKTTGFNVCTYRRPYNAETLEIYPEKTIKAIISKAQEIERDYPNAEIFNAVHIFNECYKHYMERNIHSVVRGYKMPLNSYIDKIKQHLDKLTELQKYYERALTVLKASKDPRAKQIIRKIESDIYNLTKYQDIHLYSY